MANTASRKANMKTRYGSLTEFLNLLHTFVCLSFWMRAKGRGRECAFQINIVLVSNSAMIALFMCRTRNDSIKAIGWMHCNYECHKYSGKWDTGNFERCGKRERSLWNVRERSCEMETHANTVRDDMLFRLQKEYPRLWTSVMIYGVPENEWGQTRRHSFECTHRSRFKRVQLSPSSLQDTEVFCRLSFYHNLNRILE